MESDTADRGGGAEPWATRSTADGSERVDILRKTDRFSAAALASARLALTHIPENVLRPGKPTSGPSSDTCDAAAPTDFAERAWPASLLGAPTT